MLEASGDFLLEEDAPVTILEEVQAAEMEVTSSFELYFFHVCFHPTGGAGRGNRVGCVGVRLHPTFEI